MLVTQQCLTLWDPTDCILSPWSCLGKNTGVGCRFLLQGNLPNPGIQAASPALDSLPSEWAAKPYINLHMHPFSFSYVPRTDIAVLCGKSSFRFLSTLRNLFPTGCTRLHSDQQYTRVPVSLSPCPYLLSLVSLMVAVLTGVKWFPIVQLYIYCVYFFNLYIWLYWVLQHAEPLAAAFGLLFTDRKSNPGSLNWECGVFTPGPPWKSFSLWFSFAFHWWLLTSKSPAPAHGSAGCCHIFWKLSQQVLRLFSNQTICRFFCYWVIWVSCIFWILISCQQRSV